MYGRALGDADYKDPKPFVSAEASVRRLDLLPEDKAVIIASDGLWDVIGDQDVVTMVDQLIQVCGLSLAGNTLALAHSWCIAYVIAAISQCHPCLAIPCDELAAKLISPNATTQLELQSSELVAVTAGIIQHCSTISCLHLYLWWPCPQLHACVTWPEAEKLTRRNV